LLKVAEAGPCFSPANIVVRRLDPAGSENLHAVDGRAAELEAVPNAGRLEQAPMRPPLPLADPPVAR
jgi:hypothetical protein